MPSGNVHDHRYLYAVIAALRQRGGYAESDPGILDYFRKAINEYNYAKASRYGLSFKPREVNIDVVKHIVGELRDLNLMKSENGRLALTNEGENIASMIERRDSDGLRKAFARLMLEKYSVFESFLKRLKEVSGSNGIPIPSVSSSVFDRCEGDPLRIADSYLSILRESCSGLILNTRKLYSALQEANIASIEKRTEKIEKLQSIIERYVIEEAFSPSIKSRRVYDFVRSRTSFLELTNYAVFDFEGFPAEVAYLISDFSPVFPHSVKTLQYASGCIYINYPSFEEILEQFKNAIIRAYNAKKDEFGYAKIADVRDQVCRQLRVSDNLFDTYFKRLYQEEPHWLSLTYSGAADIVTEKRLPIVFEKPTRELFTLLRITQGR